MDLLSRFLDEIESEHTRRAYRTDLTDFTGRLGISSPEGMAESSIADVRSYVRALQSEGLSVSTQQRRLSALRRFFDWLVDQGHSNRNPARTCQIDLPSSSGSESESGDDAVSVLSTSETESLIRATDEAGRASVRDRGVLLTILYGALRRAEVAAMDVNHVRPLGRHWVIDLPAGDSWSSAYVKIPEAVVEAIEQVQDRYGIDEGALWRSLSNRNRGTRVTPDAIYKIVRRTGKRAGLGGVTVETLRQTGLRLAMDAGATVQQVQLHGRLQSASSLDRLVDTEGQSNRLSDSAVEFVDLDV